MASAMGFFERLLSSPDKTALADLADVAGLKEALISRLERHIQMCSLGTINAGLLQVAAGQSESFKVLRAMLAEHDMWPRPPESAPHEGSNNWERLSNDLAILHIIAARIQKAVSTWQGIDSAVAEKLTPLAIADGEAESALRSLALKCDPQALD